MATQGDPRPSVREGLPTAADIGLTHKEIHEARMIRNAENANPGVVERLLSTIRTTRTIHTIGA